MRQPHDLTFLPLPNLRRLLPAVLAMLPTATLASPTLCEQGGLTRSVEVIYTVPGQPVPCEVIYDKPAEGSRETLWRATNEAGYCEAKAQEFVDNLDNLGWRCVTPGQDESLGDVDESG